ncbi:MAG: ABC transporter permease, partial [Caldisericum exile]
MFRVYLEGAECEIKRSIQYKVNALFYLSVVLIPPLALFFLWKSILSNGGNIGSYDLSAMVTYFIVTQFFV